MGKFPNDSTCISSFAVWISNCLPLWGRKKARCNTLFFLVLKLMGSSCYIVIAPATGTDQYKRICFLQKMELKKRYGSVAFWHIILVKEWQGESVAFRGLCKCTTEFQIRSALAWKRPYTFTASKGARAPYFPFLVMLAFSPLFLTPRIIQPSLMAADLLSAWDGLTGHW